MRIVCCIDNLQYKWGHARIVLAKVNALAQLDGNEVWLILMNDTLSTTKHINPNVQIINLGVTWVGKRKGRLSQLIGTFKAKYEYRRLLHKALQKIHPDVVVSPGMSEKIVLASLSKSVPCVFIREIHDVSNHARLEKWSRYEYFIRRIQEFIDYQIFINRYDRIVVLTDEDRICHWKNNKKVVAIPNPLPSEHHYRSQQSAKTVIAMGRLERQKNFSSLIRSWKEVTALHPEWKLEIWGDGSEKVILQELIDNLDLQNCVFLKGYAKKPISQIAAGSIFVFTSIYEGFGLVIIEAMSCGIPVVAYDCDYGPRNIITDGKDGILIPVGDEKAMASRIAYLIEQENVRKQMGVAALVKSKKYSMDNITSKWMRLFEQSLTVNKE